MTTHQNESTPTGVYTTAINEYLDGATWLTALDAPFKVHAQQLARSLDQQLAKNGEVQSALASSFDKVLVRLEARRPKPVPGPPAPGQEPGGVEGQTSVFEYLGDG